MPTIQQERGVKSVKGLPTRWGVRAYRELSAALKGEGGATSERYQTLAKLLDEVTAAPFPLDATDAHLCVLAERYAGDCARVGLIQQPMVTDAAELRALMAHVCRVRGIPAPTVEDDEQAIARCTDPAWWRRNMRKVHGRTMEAAAIRLGFVNVRAGAYASNETVARRTAQVARNKAALASVTMVNDEGQEYGLDALAAKSTSNKRNRKGELMVRVEGCEDIAIELGHVGIFFTITAPSKYHGALAASGAMNPRYKNLDPRMGQKYLTRIWGHMRADYGRHGIKPYGFRVTEPHHDGCPHWHGLVFLPREQVDAFCAIVRKHALKEDGDEPGARAIRCKFERIDSARGTAAGYIVKYISKNIDDDSDDGKDEVLDAAGNVVRVDIANDKVKRASQRVDAWAGVWGIRQFQPIGLPPVTVYREFRRIREEQVQGAPEHVRAAWAACQRVEITDKETGEVTVQKRVDFAAYIRAQGGVCRGRDYAIAIACEAVRVEGRYGVYDGSAPVGVYDRAAPAAVYASTRYSWTRVQAGGRASAPWSPVNNCTETAAAPAPAPFWWTGQGTAEPLAQFDDEWFQSDEYRNFVLDPTTAGQQWHAAEVAAHSARAATVWTRLSSEERYGPERGIGRTARQ